MAFRNSNWRHCFVVATALVSARVTACTRCRVILWIFMQIRKIRLAFCSCNFMIYNAYFYDLWTFIYLSSKLGIFWVFVYHVNLYQVLRGLEKRSCLRRNQGEQPLSLPLHCCEPIRVVILHTQVFAEKLYERSLHRVSRQLAQVSNKCAQDYN